MKSTWKTLVAAGVMAFGAMSGANAAYEVVDHGIAKPHTEQAGNADEGRKIMVNRKLGNCLACHAVSVLQDQPFHGEVGPALNGVAERYSEEQLRLIVTDAKQIFEGTVMPSFMKTSGFIRVREDLEGKSILTPQQVEDVIAFLKTLK